MALPPSSVKLPSGATFTQCPPRPAYGSEDYATPITKGSRNPVTPHTKSKPTQG